MGIIKIESFDVDISDGTTHALAEDVGSLSNAFIRRGLSDKCTGGPTGSTGNTNPNDAHAGVTMTTTSQLTFHASNATVRKIMGEIWRYTGAANGPDEFIKRQSIAVTITGATSTVAVSGIVNRNKCIPFITGIETSIASVSDYEGATFAAHIDASDNLVLSKNNAITGSTVYVDVVEFTGSNWSVSHAVSTNHDATDPIIFFNTDSTGIGGSIAVAPAESSVAELNMGGDSSETGLSDVLATCKFVTDTSIELRFHNDGDAGSRNDSVAYIHAFTHPSLSAYRSSIASIAEGNGTYGSAGWPSGAPTNRTLDELALEWYSDTSGTGTAHARGRLQARITDPTGTIQHWVHRSGNDVGVQYAVIDLSGIDGTVKPIISTLSITTIPSVGALGVIVTGENYGAVQGAGKVQLSDNENFVGGIIIDQTVSSWANDSITFDTVTSGLIVDSLIYLRVIDDVGTSSTAFSLFYGNPTYKSIISEGLSRIPDHYIPFDNDYIAALGGINGETRTGTVSFEPVPLVRGSVGSLFIQNASSGARMNDSTFINLSSQPTRQLLIWIRLASVPETLVCFYEEGGSVNNLAFYINAGGILIAQLADTGDDNVHVYSDFVLEANRTYCVLFEFDYSLATPADRQFKLFIDGIRQSSDFGNPLTATDLDSHSGDISFGLSETSLEVFGTDVSFPSPICYLAEFASWRQTCTDSEKRVEMFELGALAENYIISGTELAMQADVDTYADTVHGNEAMTFSIQSCLAGSFQLIFDNIVFNNSSSIFIQYLGPNTLTIINANGSNLQQNKVSTPYGGTVNIITPSTLKLTGLQSATEVQVFEAGTTNLIASIESVSLEWETSIQQNSVDISIMSLGYQNVRIKGLDTTSNALVPVSQEVDRQYENN